MFEAAAAPAETLTTAALRALRDGLAHLDADVTDAERVDQVRLLEEVKAAAAAAQVRVVAAFDASQRREQRAAGVRAEEVGAGIAGQVGLARRESPYRARRFVGWSKILLAELPETFAALQAGRTTEWRAMIVARETAWLSVEHRLQVDAELAAHLERWGDRRIEAEVRKLAYRLDPRGYTSRLAKAEGDRRVTLRPAPDCMSSLNALLPVAQGVSVVASLSRHADSLRSQGDDRSRGQIMADTLVERVTGQATAQAAPVQVNLLMTDQALLDAGPDSEEPAHVMGFGTVPAEVARRLAEVADRTATARVRRLFTDPMGRLVAMESTSRRFDGLLAELLALRDQACRTPWCDAPVRHGDHVVPVELGGPTSEANGQGLCEACNQAKRAPGWRARASGAGAGELVEVTTPTGHTYLSRPPDPPGTRGPRVKRTSLPHTPEMGLTLYVTLPSAAPKIVDGSGLTALEQRLRELVDAA